MDIDRESIRRHLHKIDDGVNNPFIGLVNHEPGNILLIDADLVKKANEIKEELDTDIEVGQLIGTIECDYPDFHLSMDCFWCGIREGSLVLKEAQEARWLTRSSLEEVRWLPADLTLIPVIRQEMTRCAAK